jgi:hypothetical protein
MAVIDVVKSPFGAIVVSIILGLGLAALFRTACKGRDCIVFKAPSRNDTNSFVYKIDDTCYKYEPMATSCEKE